MYNSSKMTLQSPSIIDIHNIIMHDRKISKQSFKLLTEYEKSVSKPSLRQLSLV